MTTTTVAPAGEDTTKESAIPIRKQMIESAAAQKITLQKVLHTRMAVSAGKISRLEISSAPIIRMPRTMVIAVRNARSML